MSPAAQGGWSQVNATPTEHEGLDSAPEGSRMGPFGAFLRRVERRGFDWLPGGAFGRRVGLQGFGWGRARRLEEIK